MPIDKSGEAWYNIDADKREYYMEPMLSDATEENKSAQSNREIISPKKNTVRLVAAIVCVAVSAFSLTMGIIAGGSEEICAFFVSLFMVPAAVLGIKYFVFLHCLKHAVEPPELKLPLAAIGAELAAVPMFYAGFFALLPFLFVPILIIIGIVLGIGGICDRKRNGKVGLTLSIIAVVLPFVVVATLLILLSARVIVIRWM